MRDLCEHGHDFETAMAEVRRTTAFTTHTPVAAGHDAFPFHMVETHLAGLWGDLGPNREKFLQLGHFDNGAGPQFNMTALALRSAASVNGVSQLHGEVTKQMWRSIWPDKPADKLPVKFVTNGVHVPTWLASDMARLLEQVPGRGLAGATTTTRPCAIASSTIPDEELWATRAALRGYLFQFVRERARQRWTTEGGAAARVVAAGTMFDQGTLTIGFARRFTSYKRPELLFSDPDRLARIVNAWGRPVQFVFAGKAHPADDAGKHHLQRIYRHALDPKFGGRIAVVDDYDLHVSHFLVQGCDVWMNNPRKPLEASGTSGMKAAINGTPHMSIGDGWWAEGFTGENGWLIEGTGQSRRPGRAGLGRRAGALHAARAAARARPSTSATPRASRGAGSRWCASRSARCCRASARGAWSRNTRARCTGRRCSRRSAPSRACRSTSSTPCSIARSDPLGHHGHAE